MTQLYKGDCLEKLGEIQSAYIDAIITDPPYGLSFMGKKWDYEVPSVAIWKECLRVLKPGGHLLSFSSARTYHRMACNIEDAGFGIIDQIMWVYGSGFPKGKSQLKPSHEPIVMARKGGKKQELRINDCRVGNEERTNPISGESKNCYDPIFNQTSTQCLGRWPANLIHDGNINIEAFNNFFYCAKASNSDRGKGNNHPTVKPIDLMRYLIRLVCPVGSVVLDPFMGSGTTGKAALEEGMEFIGIEQSKEYMDISKKRLTNVAYQAGLFT